MNYEKIKLKSKTIMGVKERTSNALESDFENAKIPSLWRAYFQSAILDPIPNEVPDTPPYAIYCNYENGVNGEYDVIVGAQVSKTPKFSAPYEVMNLKSGTYLRFDAKGKMPMATVELWAKIWHFFEKNSEFKRNFETDFEVYPGEDEVSIYIGIHE
jgi:predicted transcriptional regulator YdeE